MKKILALLLPLWWQPTPTQAQHSHVGVEFVEAPSFNRENPNRIEASFDIALERKSSFHHIILNPELVGTTNGMNLGKSAGTYFSVFFNPSHHEWNTHIGVLKHFNFGKGADFKIYLQLSLKELKFNHPHYSAGLIHVFEFHFGHKHKHPQKHTGLVPPD